MKGSDCGLLGGEANEARRRGKILGKKEKNARRRKKEDTEKKRSNWNLQGIKALNV